MSKNLEELKKIEDKIFETNIKKSDYKASTYKITFRYILVEILEDFEKRLTELEKYKNNILEHHEINETGGVNNIKIILNDPKLKKKGKKDGKHRANGKRIIADIFTSKYCR